MDGSEVGVPDLVRSQLPRPGQPKETTHDKLSLMAPPLQRFSPKHKHHVCIHDRSHFTEAPHDRGTDDWCKMP